MNREKYLAEKVIKFEEGLRLLPYYDSLGYPTIGFGELVGKKGDELPAIEWSEQMAIDALDKKLEQALTELNRDKSTKAAWESLEGDSDRKAILISMWYQLGIKNLSEFKGTLQVIVDKKWDEVASHMLNSLAARQTPKRWQRQASAMKSGDVVSTYHF